MKKKVVHLVYSFGCGGLEKVIVNLINHTHGELIEHIIISLTSDISMCEQLVHDIAIFDLNKPAGNDINTHIRLFKLLRQLRPDCIQTYNFGTLEYHLVAALAGVKNRIHSDHGRGGDDPKGLNKLHNTFRKIIAPLLSAYVVVSYDLYAWVVNTLKINQKKVHLVFNGVDIPSESEFLPRASEHTEFSFITVGRLDKVKNQQLLIDAFKYALTVNPSFHHCRLKIVGDGPLYNELAAYIEVHQLSNYVTLLGYKANVNTLIEQAHVFVLSSVYEAMPMTILEAMAVKRPVICTKVGGIPKFLDESQVAFVESDNCEQLAKTMLDYFEHYDQKKTIVDKAYRIVSEKYSIATMCEYYLALYQVRKNILQ